MKILIVGSGGREHALAWKVVQSSRCSRLYIASGNAGTAGLGENVPVKTDDLQGLVNLVKREGIELVLVGPEMPLAAGLVDELQAAGVRAFGPQRKAAQLESSKVFAKKFMARYQIPSAPYASFHSYDEAAAYVADCPYPLVIKASGLAAGKGVILPGDVRQAQAVLHRILVDRQFGTAGDEVVIEERLHGAEVSLMAFTDGTTVIPMLPVQDHKRLFDGDTGPNTGGNRRVRTSAIFYW